MAKHSKKSKKNGSGHGHDHAYRRKKFGTFAGVFTPDVLTILGVIMYLRLGWVVGHAGLWGAVAIILLAKTVTIFTGLSMASITTNIRIGAGGAFSIISKSLGLEAGGSIGIPFYIAQTLSAALYIIGFTAAWGVIFPEHEPLAVAGIAWAGLLAITYISAQFAIRIQYVIMAVIAVSIASFLLTEAPRVADAPVIGAFEGAGFWQVFAVFFPAVTGIMAGANMSGDLENPRRAIPFGTMSAIAVTTVIYLAIAYTAWLVATPAELIANEMIMVDKAVWGPVVIAGIMGATLSSALGSMLGAPRILQALAEQRTVPLHGFFRQLHRGAEPRNAIVFTGAIIFAALIPGNLDTLAALITMFFLITYGMLNLVVFIQQSMNIISFRPAFKVPRMVPLIGAIQCAFIMFLINWVFSLVAIVTIVVLYFWLERRGLEAEWGDIRGGLFLALAERASKLAARFPRHQISWKPDLLLPVDEPRVWSGPLLFIHSITYPSGSIFAFTVSDKSQEETEAQLADLLTPIKKQNIRVNSTVIDDKDFFHGAKLVIQTLKGATFKPNILFLTLSNAENKRDDTVHDLVMHASDHGLGSMVLIQHPRKAFGMHQTINLWLRDKSPNWHLAVLVTLHLHRNWGGEINLVTAAEHKSDEAAMHAFLEHLSDQARLPSATRLRVVRGAFEEALEGAPRADINIFGLGEAFSIEFMRKAAKLSRASCLFVRDSGAEDALV